MLYRKTEEFDSFLCVADKCPETCCAGWQIMIDEDSLDYYGEVEGEFGTRLRNSIDWQEGCFYQNAGRCAFLNDKNLCDLYTALGENALCETCTRYPRHVEEFDGVREWSLSLSCPIVAQQILTRTDKAQIIEYETDEEEDIDEFEDFDILMYTQLEDARDVCVRILQDRNLTIQQRMEVLMRFATELQACITEERYNELQDVTEKFSDIDYGSRQDFASYLPWDEEEKRALFQIVDSLERLREDWDEVLDEMYETLYAEDGSSTENTDSDIMETTTDEAPGANSFEEGAWTEFDPEIMSEQLLFFFVFTYFNGAVYDDMIYSKMALAVYSTAFIRELWKAAYLQKKDTLSTAEMVRLAYRYAREIEHSDENLNQLEDIFMERIVDN